MSDDDLIRRKDVLDEILKWRLESGPISTVVYDKVRDIPAAENEPWQDIATAPNNQSVILARWGTRLMVTGRRSGPISGWRHCHSSDPVCFEPTHWRHYPEPPRP